MSNTPLQYLYSKHKFSKVTLTHNNPTTQQLRLKYILRRLFFLKIFTLKCPAGKYLLEVGNKNTK